MPDEKKTTMVQQVPPPQTMAEWMDRNQGACLTAEQFTAIAQYFADLEPRGLDDSYPWESTR